MGGNRYGKMAAIAALVTFAWSAVLPLLAPSGARAGQPPQTSLSTTSLSISAPSSHSIGPIRSLNSGQPTIPEIASAREYLEQGKQAYQGGKFAAATDYFEQALKAAQDTDKAQAYTYLSLAQQQQGHWDAAQRSVSQSLELIQRLPASHIQQLLLGRALNTQGSLYLSQGRAKAALEAWQQAVTTYGSAGDRTRQLGSLLNQSQALQSLGYYSLARHALEEVERGLVQEPLNLRVLGLHHLGEMYWHIGELQKSRDVLLKAKQAAETAQNPALKSAVLLSLGNTEQARSNEKQALEYYQQAAELDSEAVGFQATLNQFRLLLRSRQPAMAQALIPILQSQLQGLSVNRDLLYGAANFAEGLMRLAFPEESFASQAYALQVEPQSLPVLARRPLGQKRSILKQSRRHLGRRPRRRSSELDGALNRPISSVDLAAAASTPTEQARLAVKTLAWVVKTADALGDTRASIYGQGYLGHAYELAQQWDAALALTQQAIAKANRIQARDIGYQWQWQAARIHQAQAQQSTSSEDAEAHQQAAKLAYEKSVDILKSLRNDLVAVQPDVQFSFQEQVEPIYRGFVDLLLQLNEALPEDSPEREDTLQLARQVLESFQVAELNNFFRAACIQEKEVDLDKIERDGTAVMYPIILRDRLAVIWSLPGQPLRSYTTPVKKAQVEETVTQLRNNLELKFTSPEGKDAGADLYNWLIRPVDATLKENNIQTLTFILDGALRDVPMAALYRREKKRYLVQDYSIALTPGLQLIAPKTLNLSQGKTLLAGVSEARNKLSALPFVKEELTQLSQLTRGKMLLDRRFTRKALEENVKTSAFSIVHLATHGQFSSEAEKTYISAWDTKVSVGQLSSALQGRDRSDPIELLVLSACETAEGDKRAVLGLAGLAVQAGARSTLASLWSLDDEAGSKFIQKFYHALAEDKSRAKALQEAQVALLKDPQYRHPTNWASYVLVGNWL